MSTSSQTAGDDPRALPWALRVALWDAALAAVRTQLRGGGLLEVSTPCRVRAVALEPWIEPIPAGRDARGGQRWLATSPELSMKQLLARGAPSIFQIAHVFRAAEVGARHSEEFHLIEWYRVSADLPAIMADVEAVVAAVFAAVEPILARAGLAPGLAPKRWREVSLVERMGESLGCQLRGDEAAEALLPHLRRVRADLGMRLAEGDGAPGDDELGPLEAWTELFSLLSARDLDPWLAQLGAQGEGVHVVAFPAALAALSEREGATAARFESHALGVELANGYRELREAGEQRRRFEAVAELRARHDLAPLPMPEAFLAEVDALPPCAGVALGLDRLLALACGRARLDQVSISS
ncbi:hypothetical protein G6O69_28790 [Pseudenhygromyxa sp. WMMC2535]|uniref:amino acid--tRNA ligase-related protein n=1 Tax=Pseudenhygromyxa sp. WMMC2535 TaxID=2712867 RepID=UPI001556D2B8|nr:hypothetical protein [Pseudenhygromyxa sp. WMMC2535]